MVAVLSGGDCGMRVLLSARARRPGRPGRPWTPLDALDALDAPGTVITSAARCLGGAGQVQGGRSGTKCMRDRFWLKSFIGAFDKRYLGADPLLDSRPATVPQLQVEATARS